MAGSMCESEELKAFRERYRKRFPDGDSEFGKTIRGVALKHALDIRKFEIDLYWKRATYFWAFIAAAFAGYIALQRTSDGASPSDVLSFSVLCVGFAFSIGWCLVNLGSKAWQENWELHVDFLENEFMGPLYKTVMSRPSSGMFPKFYSPSKINQLLSTFVALLWFFLMARALLVSLASPLLVMLVPLMFFVTMLFAVALAYWGVSSHVRQRSNIPEIIERHLD
jgi:hypothetical protein